MFALDSGLVNNLIGAKTVRGSPKRRHLTEPFKGLIQDGNISCRQHHGLSSERQSKAFSNFSKTPGVGFQPRHPHSSPRLKLRSSLSFNFNSGKIKKKVISMVSRVNYVMLGRFSYPSKSSVD